MKVKEYFDKKAKNYDSERSHGFIGNLVKRERRLVLRLLDPKKNEKILDAGCGSGYFAMAIKQRGAKIFGVDISSNMIDILKEKGIEGRVANIEKLQLGRKFDKILCAGALEFTNSPLKAIRTIALHLKKGGILVLVYPRNSLVGYTYRLFHGLHNVKIHLFSLERIKSLARKSSLKVVCIKRGHPLCNVAVFRK